MVVGTFLPCPHSIDLALRHPVVLRHDVDENTEERNEDREDEPPRPAQAGEIGSAENVAHTLNSKVNHMT